MWDDEPTWRCYACGEPGHYARDCDRKEVTSAGPWPPQPPQYRRDTSGPKADSHAWADKIFAQMGWERPSAASRERKFEGQQETARRHVDEARRERGKPQETADAA